MDKIMFRLHLDMSRCIFRLSGRNKNGCFDLCCQVFIRSLYRHLAAIFTGDRRRGRSLDTIRYFEVKKRLLLLGCLVDIFGGRGRTWARGLLRELIISRDVNCVVGLEGGTLIYWFWL